MRMRIQWSTKHSHNHSSWEIIFSFDLKFFVHCNKQQKSANYHKTLTFWQVLIRCHLIAVSNFEVYSYIKWEIKGYYHGTLSFLIFNYIPKDYTYIIIRTTNLVPWYQSNIYRFDFISFRKLHWYISFAVTINDSEYGVW